ncbi:MAG: hypothetical protein JWN85_3610 [Gammaproteobacteria bacterium]|nr:hypothetical protein [Gammaproteobacteria bacterium]
MVTKLSLAATVATLGAVAAFTANVAVADITLEHKISVEGVGIMSVGNMSGTTKMIISGQRSRNESDLQLQSRFIRMLARSAVGPTAEIVRLDQDRIDRLNLKKKEYTEVTFEELRTQLQKAMDSTKQNQQASPKPMDDSKCEWLDPKVDVKRSGEKATYAGYEAERLTITASQPCKDRQTGTICEVALSLDEWLAPKFTSGAEANKFQHAYAQKMGLDTAYDQDISRRAQSMFGQYKGIWTQIASKTKDVKGYPVKTSFAFAFGGEQCKNAPSSQQGNSEGSSSGTSNTPGGLAGQIGGKLGSLFHRKKDDSPPPATADAAAQPAPAPALPGGLVPLITMTSELVSISTDSASPDVFEVPADFKKVEHKTE